MERKGSRQSRQKKKKKIVASSHSIWDGRGQPGAEGSGGPALGDGGGGQRLGTGRTQGSPVTLRSRSDEQVTGRGIPGPCSVSDLAAHKERGRHLPSLLPVKPSHPAPGTAPWPSSRGHLPTPSLTAKFLFFSLSLPPHRPRPPGAAAQWVSRGPGPGAGEAALVVRTGTRPRGQPVAGPRPQHVAFVHCRRKSACPGSCRGPAVPGRPCAYVVLSGCL